MSDALSRILAAKRAEESDAQPQPPRVVGPQKPGLPGPWADEYRLPTEGQKKFRGIPSDVKADTGERPARKSLGQTIDETIGDAGVEAQRAYTLGTAPALIGRGGGIVGELAARALIDDYKPVPLTEAMEGGRKDLADIQSQARERSPYASFGGGMLGNAMLTPFMGPGANLAGAVKTAPAVAPTALRVVGESAKSAATLGGLTSLGESASHGETDPIKAGKDAVKSAAISGVLGAAVPAITKSTGAAFTKGREWWTKGKAGDLEKAVKGLVNDGLGDGAKITPHQATRVEQMGKRIVREATTGPDAEAVHKAISSSAKEGVEQIQEITSAIHQARGQDYKKFVKFDPEAFLRKTANDPSPKMQEARAFVEDAARRGDYADLVPVDVGKFKAFMNRAMAVADREGDSAARNQLRNFRDNIEDAANRVLETDGYYPLGALRGEISHGQAALTGRTGGVNANEYSRVALTTRGKLTEVMDDLVRSMAGKDKVKQEAAEAIIASNKRTAALLTVRDALKTRIPKEEASTDLGKLAKAATRATTGAAGIAPVIGSLVTGGNVSLSSLGTGAALAGATAGIPAGIRAVGRARANAMIRQAQGRPVITEEKAEKLKQALEAAARMESSRRAGKIRQEETSR